jgi:murein L,D-transpeptidase YcbB/YkuD
MILTRRHLLSTSAAFLTASAAGVRAQTAAPAEQAEWAQNYEAGSRVRAARSTTPILSAEALAATEEMAKRYGEIVAKGGWGRFDGPANLKLGSRSPAVVALRQRLIASGDLDASVGSSTVYDSYVEAAVRRFQLRHGFGATGALNPATVAAMNVPAETRVKQLELNVVRLRSYSGGLGQRFVIVNIPAALVETVENERVVTRHAAGVGKIDRQSPVMNAKITQVNFNPFWTAPASVVRKDLIPKMQKEPNYLTENKIRIYNGAARSSGPSRSTGVRTRPPATCSGRIRAAT